MSNMGWRLSAAAHVAHIHRHSPFEKPDFECLRIGATTVNLFCAESSRARARGAPSQRRWSAERPAIRPTRDRTDPLAPRAALRGCWPPSQLLFSGFLFSDSGWGQTMELGRLGRGRSRNCPPRKPRSTAPPINRPRHATIMRARCLCCCESPLGEANRLAQTPRPPANSAKKKSRRPQAEDTA